MSEPFISEELADSLDVLTLYNDLLHLRSYFELGPGRQLAAKVGGETLEITVYPSDYCNYFASAVSVVHVDWQVLAVGGPGYKVRQLYSTSFLNRRPRRIGWYCLASLGWPQD